MRKWDIYKVCCLVSCIYIWTWPWAHFTITLSIAKKHSLALLALSLILTTSLTYLYFCILSQQCVYHIQIIKKANLFSNEYLLSEKIHLLFIIRFFPIDLQCLSGDDDAMQLRRENLIWFFFFGKIHKS